MHAIGHHKYFECNYALNGAVQMDKWIGSLHDGTPEADALMRERCREAHAPGVETANQLHFGTEEFLDTEGSRMRHVCLAY
jgi:hypothetical protein